MSWLSKEFKKIGDGAKRLVTDPGKWVENAGRSVGATVRTAAPLLSAVPGIGPEAAALLGALGNTAAGGNLKGSLGSGLKTYAIGSAFNAIPGVNNIGSKIGSGLSHIPGVSEVGSALSHIPGVTRFLPSSATPMGGAGASGAALPPPVDANLAGAPGAASAEAGASAAAPVSGFGSQVMKAIGGVGSAIKDNPLVAGQVASGVLNAREQGAQNALQQEQFNYQRQLTDDERKRQQQTASLLAPLFQQYLQRANQSSPWSNYTPYTPFQNSGGVA
jgi:hypothetical protein